MKKKEIKVSEIVRFLDKEVDAVYGDTSNIIIDNVADPMHITSSTLDWVNSNKTDKQSIAENTIAKVVIADPLVVYSETMRAQEKVLICVKNPKRALARIGNHFFVEKPMPGIHPTAIIDPASKIGKDVHVGPYSVIGKAIIGDGCVIDSNVRIHDDVTIGCNCDIKAGVVLGGAGFGFEMDEDGNKFRFPQIGGLVIGDDVEIGANTCIDRGALSDTVIGDHTKINNLCHIAHNNRIGRNVTITGCVNVSGSNVIDDDVWIAPNASIVGFVHLGKGCLVGLGAVVTKDVPAGETWVGNPAKKVSNNK